MFRVRLIDCSEATAYYCRDCGGLSGEEAILALNTLDRQGTLLTMDEAKAVFGAIAESEAACQSCGEPTLAGALGNMLAEDEQE